MATVQNTIALHDRLTPVLNKVMRDMSSTLTAMERLNTATNNPNVGKAIDSARRAIQGAEAEILQFNAAANQTPPIGDRISRSFGGIGGAIVVVNQALDLGQRLFGLVDSTARWADSFVNVKARLDNINDGLQTTDELNQMILESANRSRGSYQQSADMIAKLGSMAGGAFGNTAEIVAFSEVLNKGLITSGQSAGDAAGSILQLTQGLASGTLRGDELNSVMEGMPVVAQAVAKYMGQVNDKGQGNIGALRKLAEQGLITADIVKNAMFAASGDINKQFENMPITWGQAVQVFQNKFGAAMQPIIERFSQFMKAGNVTAFFDTVIAGITSVVNAALWLIEKIQQIGSFVQQNAQQITGVLTTIGIILTAVLIPKIYAAIAAWVLKAKTAVVGALKTAAAWALANWQIVLIAIAIGILIGWWGQMGTIAQAVLIGIIIALILVKLAAMGVSWPFLILIGILLIVISGFLFFQDAAITVMGVIVGAVFWLGAVFANIGIGIANGALAVAEFFANVWNDAVYAVQMLWYNLQTGVLKIISGIVKAAQGMVNNLASMISTIINVAVGGINGLIGALNKIPGVNIDKIGEVDLKTKGDWSAGIDETIKGIEEPVKKDKVNLGRFEYKDLGAAFEEGQKFGENLGTGIADKLGEFKEGIGGFLNNLTGGEAGEQEDINDYLNNVGQATTLGGDGKVKGGKLDKVGKIDSEVDISDTDLKYLKDIAQAEYVNKFTTLTPNMTVNISDVKETADVNAIVGVVEDIFVGAVNGALFTT